MDSRKKRKRKAYIISSNPFKKRKAEFNLVAGMRGFICTCNGNEKGCIKEALNILDEYDLKMNCELGSTNPSGHKCDSDDDIEEQLRKEVDDEKNSDKKFKVVGSGATNCLFISSKVKNVVEMVEKIMKDAKEANSAKSRFLIRLLPIEVTCKAYNDDIKKAAEEILDSHFKCEQPISFCVLVNKRNNNNLLRMEVADDLGRLVRDRNRNHIVNFKNPAKTVIVEIIKNICCLAVVNNFFQFKKFNLIELGNINRTPVPKKTSEKTGPEADHEKSSKGTVQDDIGNSEPQKEVNESVKEVHECSEEDNVSEKEVVNECLEISEPIKEDNEGKEINVSDN